MKQISHKQIEKANKANVLQKLLELLENEYGDAREVDDGIAVPVGLSPLDKKQMWVVVSVTAKTIQDHKWGKTTRKYYDGYAEAQAFQVEKAQKEEKERKKKENHDKNVKKGQ